MTQIRIIVDGERSLEGLCTPDELDRAEIVMITGLARGMVSGATSVALVSKTAAGRFVFSETSLRGLQLATAALTYRHGDPDGILAGTVAKMEQERRQQH